MTTRQVKLDWEKPSPSVKDAISKMVDNIDLEEIMKGLIKNLSFRDSFPRLDIPDSMPLTKYAEIVYPCYQHVLEGWTCQWKS